MCVFCNFLYKEVDVASSKINKAENYFRKSHVATQYLMDAIFGFVDGRINGHLEVRPDWAKRNG